MNAYMATRNPIAAERMERRIRERIEALREMPLTGVATGQGDTRWVPVLRTPYLIVYRVIDDELRISAIFHTRRNR